MPRWLKFPETLVGDVALPSARSAAHDRESHRFTMRLQWFIPDLDALFADSRHRVVVTGTVQCEPLGGKLRVPSGEVELFAEDAGLTVMNYRLYFQAANGEPLVLQGTKQIVHDRPKDLWPDTTTLPIEVRQSTGEGDLVLSGTVNLTLPRVLRAIVGMRASGPALEAAGTIVAFDRFFLTKLAVVYLAAVRRPAALAGPR